MTYDLNYCIDCKKSPCECPVGVQEMRKTLAVIAYDMQAGDFSTIMEWKEKAKKWDESQSRMSFIHMVNALPDPKLSLIMQGLVVDEKCKECKGKGEIEYTHDHEDSTHFKDCGECDGTGKITRIPTAEEVREWIEYPLTAWVLNNLRYDIKNRCHYFILNSGAILRLEENK